VRRAAGTPCAPAQTPATSAGMPGAARRFPAGPGRILATLALTGILGLAAACESVSSLPSPVASPPSSPTPNRETSGPSIVGPATPTPGIGSLVLDESLLDILPPDVDGTPVSPAPESFADIRDDADLNATVEAIAFFVVAGPSDLASGSVSKLRPGAWSDGFWRDWRDTYDEGACAQAGGVVGNAEAILGGRKAYITSCAGGLYVYHVHLGGPDLVVSLFSVGEGRLGERLVEEIRG
jgi:hypothetical protein